jgi:hypothetical protein
MVSCKKCGNENPLGRVFCVKCGTKLDLTHMTSEHVQEIQKTWSDPLVKYWPKAAAAIVFLALALVGLAFWPDSGLIGKKGTRLDGHKVESAMASIKSLKTGGTMTMAFTEEDINGYFDFFKTKGMNMQSISVSVMDGCVFVRIVKPLKSIPIPKFQVSPVMSYELQCVPYGGQLMVASVKVGHLSMFGPLKTSALRTVYGILAKETEWANMKSISDIKCAAGKITIQVVKK